MFIRSVAIVSLALSTITVGAACSGPEATFSRRRSAFSSIYLLRLDEAKIVGSGAGVPADDDSCAELATLRICASVSGEFFDIEISNLGAEPVSVFWESALYIDETGVQRDVNAYFSQSPDSKSTALSPKQSVVKALVAADKRYYRSDTNGQAYEYVEPLIPWNSESLSASAAEAAIAKLHDNGSLMLLLLPVEVSNSKRMLQLTLRLSKREFALPSPIPASELK